MAPLPRRVTRPLNALLARDRPGYGKRPFLDRAFWLDIEPSSEPWIAALAALDASGDKQPLVRLLEAGQPPQEICVYLADLLKRHQLKRKRGNQATPLYDLSKKDQEISFAVIEMRRLHAGGLSFDDALEQASELHDISDNQLRDAYRGRRSSIRRRIKALSRKA